MDLNYVENVLVSCIGKSQEFKDYQIDKLLKDIKEYKSHKEYIDNVYNKLSAIEKFKIENDILKGELKYILREGTREDERKKIEEILFNLGSAITYLTDVLNNPEINKYNYKDYSSLNSEEKKTVGIVRQLSDSKISLEQEKRDFVSSLTTLREEYSREKELMSKERFKLSIELEKLKKDS